MGPGRFRSGQAPTRPYTVCGLSQEFFQRALSVRESLLQLATDKKFLSQFAEPPISQVVLNRVANDGSPQPIPSFFSQLVAMMKSFERSLLLYVSKMVVPLEFSNEGGPLSSKRKKRNHTERRDNFRTDARQQSAVRDGCALCWKCRRQYQVQPDQFGSVLRRHDSRQIAGVGKKEKYALDRHRNPLFELNHVIHNPPPLRNRSNATVDGGGEAAINCPGSLSQEHNPRKIIFPKKRCL